MNPFFSVIMPTHNRQAVISKAIDSVVQQSFTEWELIIVDDGSTDNTYEFLTAKYLDPRIKVFTKIHAERSAARNFGLERVSGNYICFLDSDDEYLPGFLELHHSAILAHPEYKVFRVGTYLVKNDERIPLPFPDPAWSALEAICREFNGFPSYCFERDLLQSFRFVNRFFVAQDFHFIFKLLSQGLQFKQIESYSFLIHYNPQSELSKGNNINRMVLKIEVFEDLIKTIWMSDNIKKMLEYRILIVHLLIVQLFLKEPKPRYFLKLIKALKYLLLHPLLTFSTIYNLKLKGDHNGIKLH